MSYAGWIGVDLDGTLAVYDGWHGLYVIGKPIAPMVDRIKGWLAEGQGVRIMTARVSGLSGTEGHYVRAAIQDWLEQQCGLPRLPVTCIKDFNMIELWDDRAVTVEPNTGVCLVPPRTRQGLE